MNKLLPIAFAITLFHAPIAYADNSNDPCAPRDQLLINAYVKNVNTCIYYLTHTLRDAEQRAFAEQLITKALTDKKHGNRGRDVLNYMNLAELAALIDTPEVVDVFLAFNLRTADGDELRAFAMGRLYELRTPLVLDRLALRPKNEQERIVNAIAWGLANNFDLFMNLDNYRRLSVGSNWEVLDSKHPRRALSKRIEESIEFILRDPRK
jgi:hypothetical protein